MPSRVVTISDGSRPTSLQWPRSTSSLCATVAGPPDTLHMSPYCATSRSVRFSPLPPIMIGGPPGWIGRGTLRASVIE